MKTHIVTLHITAPNRLTKQEVLDHTMRLIWIGKEDAADSLDRGEGDMKGAKDAMSLHIKPEEIT